MGRNIAEHLMEHGYKVVIHDKSAEATIAVEELGASGTSNSVKGVVRVLSSLRAGDKNIIWLMLPSGEPTQETVKELSKHLKPGDIVIDGSNSYYENSMANYNLLKQKGVSFLDVGSSGGPEGARKGMSLMVGGDKEAFNYVEPLLRDLSFEHKQYAYVGPAGSGHFVKMVHNAIEYADMAARGEGFNIIKAAFPAVDLKAVADVWSKGAVISGRLTELSSRAFEHRGNDLKDVAPYVPDTGEGRWTSQVATQLGVPAPLLKLALDLRQISRGGANFGFSLESALRGEFGGHEVKAISKPKKSTVK